MGKAAEPKQLLWEEYKLWANGETPPIPGLEAVAAEFDRKQADEEERQKRLQAQLAEDNAGLGGSIVRFRSDYRELYATLEEMCMDRPHPLLPGIVYA